ncbi:hypothetical protein LSAT2_020711 [Lamellibrachia satsuma]|nr:hypothetical protein LSAT2_020711 [Lamellibrachia satsuma]
MTITLGGDIWEIVHRLHVNDPDMATRGRRPLQANVESPYPTTADTPLAETGTPRGPGTLRHLNASSVIPTIQSRTNYHAYSAHHGVLAGGSYLDRLVTWSVRRGLVATLTETVEKACALVCQPKDFVCGNDLVSPAHTATDPLGRSSWFFSCRKQLDLQVRRWATKQCQQTTVCMSGYSCKLQYLIINVTRTESFIFAPTGFLTVVSAGGRSRYTPGDNAIAHARLHARLSSCAVFMCVVGVHCRGVSRWSSANWACPVPRCLYFSTTRGR